MPYNIVKMTMSHTRDVAEIEKICFSKPWSQKSIEEELKNDCAYFYIITYDNATAGYCGMHIAAHEAYIANIAVLPQYRGNNLGKILTQHLINTAQNNECDFITLEVRPSNTVAVNIYKSLGFKKVGTRKNFYTSPSEDALIMTLNLLAKD